MTMRSLPRRSGPGDKGSVPSTRLREARLSGDYLPRSQNRHPATARGCGVSSEKPMQASIGRASAGSASVVVVSVSVQSFLGGRSSVVDVAGHKRRRHVSPGSVVPGQPRATKPRPHTSTRYRPGSTVTWCGSPPVPLVGAGMAGSYTPGRRGVPRLGRPSREPGTCCEPRSFRQGTGPPDPRSPAAPMVR